MLIQLQKNRKGLMKNAFIEGFKRLFTEARATKEKLIKIREENLI